MRWQDVTRSLTRYDQALLVLFLITLPMINPWVRGDGVGYYAYARALLIQRNLRFERDWRAANPSFRMNRVDAEGNIRPDQYTVTGHLDNHFTIGPAMLWAPFLFAAHAGVLAADALGANIAADGFSLPYRLAMAGATALYGFLGILLGFRLARNYVAERWAFLAALGIWFASSLPVYMYFNPSWSHAHSAFAVALFLWYWHRTRGARTPKQWLLLGLISGLMVDVYYPNAFLLIVLLLEAAIAYRFAARVPEGRRRAARTLLANHLLFATALVLAFLPTAATRWVVYGSPFDLGYEKSLFWRAPALAGVFFSSWHGLLWWTPILALAIVGLFLFRRTDRPFAWYLMAALLAFSCFIASYLDWHGLSSYGNRFFVSWTAAFLLGLAVFLERFGNLFARARRATATAGAVVALFILWNAGLVFQWGTHLVPARGPVSFGVVAYNQVAVVPEQFAGAVKRYLTARGAMMQRIEQQDVQKLRSRARGGQ